MGVGVTAGNEIVQRQFDLVVSAAMSPVGACDGRPCCTPRHRRHLGRRPYDLLHDLAASPDPHRRRTAMTAQLCFVRYGDHTDVEAGIEIAGVLHADADPIVHKPVGIYLAYAGERLPERLTEFLDQHGQAMPRAAYRIAIRKR